MFNVLSGRVLLHWHKGSYTKFEEQLCPLTDDALFLITDQY